MKSSFLAFCPVLTCLMTASMAQASYALDLKGGAIKCRGTGAIMTIDAAHQIISFYEYGADGYGMTYNVVDSESDGKTAITYFSEDNAVILKFTKAGDSVQFGTEAQPIALKCFQLP